MSRQNIPVRRPSAATGPIPNAISSSSSRAHKSNDSHHVFNGTGNSHQHSLLSLGASATPQQRVVQVLVSRLKNRVSGPLNGFVAFRPDIVLQLPCNSGVSLDHLEADSAIQQAIQALVELSHDSLDIIAWALSELLERLAKVSSITRPRQNHSADPENSKPTVRDF